MNKLEIAKNIIEENYKYANCGIFDCENTVGDIMTTIYDEDGLHIYICYRWCYFEVFGLTSKEFEELEEYYEDLKNIEKMKKTNSQLVRTIKIEGAIEAIQYLDNEGLLNVDKWGVDELISKYIGEHK